MPLTPFRSQIGLFGFGFAPKGWAICDGRLLPINQNQALFSLLGTMYGGNGQTTFALPDLRSRIPKGGQMPTDSTLLVPDIGASGGAETVTLALANVPPHTHAISTNGLNASVRCKNSAANQLTPVSGVPALEFGPGTSFTDDPLVAGSSVVRAGHITELRARADAFRRRSRRGSVPLDRSGAHGGNDGHSSEAHHGATNGDFAGIRDRQPAAAELHRSSACRGNPNQGGARRRTESRRLACDL